MAEANNNIDTKSTTYWAKDIEFTTCEAKDINFTIGRTKDTEPTVGRATNIKDIELTAGGTTSNKNIESIIGRAINSKVIEPIIDRVTSSKDETLITCGVTNNTDTEIDVSGLSKTNNIVKKEARVYKSNILRLLLISNRSWTSKKLFESITFSSTFYLDQLLIDGLLDFNKYVGDKSTIDKKVLRKDWDCVDCKRH